MTTPVPGGTAAAFWLAVGGERVTRTPRFKCPAWKTPERNADGAVIGWHFRMDRKVGPDDEQHDQKGPRGLTMQWPLPAEAGQTEERPVFVTEGVSDTVAALGLGLDVVGAPMAGHGADHLAEVVRGRHVAICRDNDPAGIGGAEKLAVALAGGCASVRIFAPPNGYKDARAWIAEGVANARDFYEASRAAVDQSKPVNAEPESGPAPVIDGAPVIVRLSDVQPEEVSWLWPGRIALGKLTLIAGDPGLGKSFLTLDLAARVSRGVPWPDAPGVAQPTGGVVLLNAEDGVADTIHPRLDAAGADMNRIVALEAVRSVGERGRESMRTFDLSRDLLALECAIRVVGECRLVVIDPITAYLGATDSHKNAEVRGLLAPLGELAARHRVAVIAVTHLNKSGSGPAIYRAIGSLAFTAAARSAWAVCKAPDEDRRRLLLPIKNNIAPDAGGLAYRIASCGIGTRPAVEWMGAVSLSADDALGVERTDGRSERDDAGEWLRELLQGGPRLTTEVEAEANAAGFKMATVRRAKAALGIKVRKRGYGGKWEWALPAPDGAEGAHSPASEHLRAESAGFPGDSPKVRTSGLVSTFGEHLREPDPFAEDAHPPKMRTEDAHPPTTEHLRENTGGNGGFPPKMLTPRVMGAFDGPEAEANP